MEMFTDRLQTFPQYNVLCHSHVQNKFLTCEQPSTAEKENSLK